MGQEMPYDRAANAIERDRHRQWRQRALTMRAATLAVYLALVAVAVITAAAAESGRSSSEPLRIESGGAFGLADPHDGMAVFTATDLGPGDSARGTMEISNEGSEPVVVTLAQHSPLDTPGTGGGVLSQRLRLIVEDLSSASTVYAGPFAAMPARALGRLAAGASRSYEFIATLPESATENALRDSSTSVAFSWTAREVPSVE